MGRMIKEQLIEPATTKHVTIVVFSSNKDGLLRFYVEYQKLNTVLDSDLLNLSRMEGCIKSLEETIDLLTTYANSGYWQIGIDERACNKTALTSHELYKHSEMPFERKTPTRHFQRIVDITPASVCFLFALCYLQDVTVFSNLHQNHILRMRSILRQLYKTSATLK